MHENSISAPKAKKMRRSRLTQEQWAGHVAAWKESGLSKKDYCVSHDVHVSCLAKWARALGAASENKFKPVRVSVPGSGMLAGAPAVEILIGHSVRVRLTGVNEPSLVVGIVRGLTHATDY